MRSKVASSVETLTSPQLMSLETLGSSTMYLSLGERPVRSPVSVTSAPWALSTPSPRSTAMAMRSVVSRFQWTSPEGFSPWSERSPDRLPKWLPMPAVSAAPLCPFWLVHKHAGPVRREAIRSVGRRIVGKGRYAAESVFWPLPVGQLQDATETTEGHGRGANRGDPGARR